MSHPNVSVALEDCLQGSIRSPPCPVIDSAGCEGEKTLEWLEPGDESVELHCVWPDSKTLSCRLLPTAQGSMLGWRVSSRSPLLSPPNIFIDMLACRSHAGGPPCWVNINLFLQPRCFIFCSCSFFWVSLLSTPISKLPNPPWSLVNDVLTSYLKSPHKHLKCG